MAPKQGSADWLRARMAGIGGSEASVLYGKNPWMNELRLWGEKTGRIPQTEHTIHTAPQLYWGTALEPAVRQGYCDLTGRVVSEGATMHRHPDVECMISNTDGLIAEVEGQDGPGIYEGKTASAFSRRDWFDESGEPNIPIHIQVQVQHYLACTELRWASVAVFFGGDRKPLAYFDIPRHDALIEDLLERADRWWTRHVINDEQPEIDASAVTESALRAIYPHDSGTIVALPDAFAPVIDRIEAAGAIIKTAAAERQRCRNLVMATMGSASYGLTYDGRGFTYRTEGSSRVLRVASESRMNRAKKATGVERPQLVFVPPGVGGALRQISAITWDNQGTDTT